MTGYTLQQCPRQDKTDCQGVARIPYCGYGPFTRQYIAECPECGHKWKTTY